MPNQESPILRITQKELTRMFETGEAAIVPSKKKLEGKLDITNLFPSIDKWKAFLHTDAPDQANKMEEMNRYSIQPKISYKTPNNIENTVEFFTEIETKKFKPFLLYQQLVAAPKSMIEIGINDKYIWNQLRLSDPANFISNMVIRSSDQMLPNGTWVDGQEVFMALNPDYIQRLIKEQIIPEDVTQRIWIKRQKGSVTAEIEKSQVEQKLFLSDDTIRKICNDTGFIFEIDDQKGETRGIIADAHFKLRHVKAADLNSNTIWHALTGKKNGNPFIFSVELA